MHSVCSGSVRFKWRLIGVFGLRRRVLFGVSKFDVVRSLLGLRHVLCVGFVGMHELCCRILLLELGDNCNGGWDSVRRIKRNRLLAELRSWLGCDRRH